GSVGCPGLLGRELAWRAALDLRHRSPVRAPGPRLPGPQAGPAPAPAPGPGADLRSGAGHLPGRAARQRGPGPGLLADLELGGPRLGDARGAGNAGERGPLLPGRPGPA